MAFWLQKLKIRTFEKWVPGPSIKSGLCVKQLGRIIYYLNLCFHIFWYGLLQRVTRELLNLRRAKRFVLDSVYLDLPLLSPGQLSWWSD